MKSWRKDEWNTTPGETQRTGICGVANGGERGDGKRAHPEGGEENKQRDGHTSLGAEQVSKKRRMKTKTRAGDFRQGKRGFSGS